MSAEVALVVSLPPEFADAVAQRVAQLVVGQLGSTESSISWLNVGSAAQYLDTTEDAIRGLVKRGQLLPHRSTTGRLLFRRDELDLHAMGDPA